MSKRISIRFFGVERTSKSDPLLADILTAINAKSHGQREVDCSGLLIRLENVTSVRGKMRGEFTRIQKDDYPSEVDGTGRKPLNTSNDLGHSTPFCFDPAISVLALRSGSQSVTSTNIESYLSLSYPGAKIILHSKMLKDNWKDFKKSPIRKFSVTLAGFTDLNNLEGDNEAAFQSLSKFRKGYEPHLITLTMSMGQKGGSLSDSIKKTAAKLLTRENNEFEIRGMKATPDGGQEVNLIDQLLSDYESLTLPRNDPDARLTSVCDALERALVRNKGNL